MEDDTEEMLDEIEDKEAELNIVSKGLKYFRPIIHEMHWL
jgi:hypothetical protein